LLNGGQARYESVSSSDQRETAPHVQKFPIAMNAHSEFARLFLVLFAAVSGFGCSEFRARQQAREGNRHFKEGDYAAAVAAYSAAERLQPMPVISFNKGLACRQLMLPGAKSRQSQQATDCALQSFQSLKLQSPHDARADQLYQQTLFEAERFDTLGQVYLAQLQRNPSDLAALNGLIQIHSNSGHWDEALHWTIERAKRAPHDAEAQYAVGVLIYSHLFEKGGGTEQAAYDPRPNPEPKMRPVTNPGDVTGQARIALAEQGVEYLKSALRIRPAYSEAVTYLGLLYRQESFAYFDQPAKWQTAVDTAEEFRKQATALQATRRATP